MSTVIEGPLVRHLREIGEGKRPMPATRSRRHHWVPAFALKKFATPQARDGLLFQLETKTGKPSKTTPDTTAFQTDLYAQEKPDGQLDLAIEAFLAVVENYAAQAIARFEADPLNTTGEDKQTLSYFLALQYMRTPAHLDHAAATQQALAEFFLGAQFADEVGFRSIYRKALAREDTDEEIEAFRKETQKQLADGALSFEQPRITAFRTLLSAADDVAHTIANLEWVLLTASEDEFISSDQPMALHDPSPRFPWSGHALVSSPDAETSFPISPQRLLVLSPGQPRVGTGTVAADGVRELNLRTYSWSTKFIYGRTQEVVQRVRRQTKTHRHLLVVPRRTMQVVMEEANPNDPSVGAEHAKKGWPRGLWSRGQFHAYTLIDPEDQSSISAAIRGHEISRRVMERARTER